MELKGSKTEANLMAAFAGESQARNKYTYYASKAKKEGFEQIAAIFLETAENEKEHAKLWFKELHDGDKVAKEEGFTRIATLFEEVGKIEKEHEERYRKLISNMDEGLVFSSEGDTIWVCRNCGHVVVGKKAPDVCPVCKHPQSFFERKANNY